MIDQAEVQMQWEEHHVTWQQREASNVARSTSAISRFLKSFWCDIIP